MVGRVNKTHPRFVILTVVQDDRHTFTIKLKPPKGGLNFMAERVGFEPTDRVTTVTD